MTLPARLVRFPLLLASLLVSGSVHAINFNDELTRDVDVGTSGGQFIPYAFFNDSTGFAVATVFLGKGFVQPQVITVANAFVGTSGSYNLFLANTDMQIPWSDRLYVDQVAMYSDWDEVDTYQNGNPNFPFQRAGSNSSSENNFVKAEGDDLFFHFNFKYLLPLGDGRSSPPHNFNLTNGILEPETAAGGRGWNPLESGRTVLELRPFYRDQNFTGKNNNIDYLNETSGLKFTLEYDNTDWYNNPTRGTSQRLTFAEDYGWLDKSVEWTAVSFRHSQYWNLGSSEKAQQRVLAFDLWTSHSPSWNKSSTDDNGLESFHRPPLFEGSTLGGLERQRGYATSRYHDRSAINYTLEYRYMPKWNPLGDIPLINKLFIPWWQWVGFIEVGRVNDQYDLSELHSSMKTSVGGGVRALVYELVIRVDVAVSEEGGEVQMFFNHPF